MENVQVPIADLLDSREVSFEPISPKYFLIILIRAVLFLVVVTAGLTGVLYFNEASPYTIGYITGVLILLVAAWLGIMKLSFKYRGVAVREYDVVFRTSFINVTETLVPYNRVQHVKLARGIFEKIFGLSELYIYTAAGGNHNLSISGLKAEDAEKIKSFIINKLKTKDGEVMSPVETELPEDENNADTNDEINPQDDTNGY